MLVTICLLAVIINACRSGDAPPSGSAYYLDIVNPAGERETVELETFLIGVVAAEMPASFCPEALKAQAIAARTYVISHCAPYGQPRHGDAAVCCDSTCCQGYIDEADMERRWGKNYGAYRAKIAAAVRDTAGIVLFYHGEIAQAPFFSTCGGSTESAAACWGGDIPYLAAVPCPYCRSSPRFAGWKRFSLTEAAAKLGVEPDDLASMETAGLTPGFRVERLKAGGKTFRGTEVRSLLGLNSAAFTWLIMGDDIIFATLGYGHGVGMCQYGTNGMAQSGFTCELILAHYYPSTEPVSLYDL